MYIFVKDQADNLCGSLVDHKITDFPIAFINPTAFFKFIAIRN
jgi:hypothetical protein